MFNLLIRISCCSFYFCYQASHEAQFSKQTSVLLLRFSSFIWCSFLLFLDRNDRKRCKFVIYVGLDFNGILILQFDSKTTIYICTEATEAIETFFFHANRNTSFLRINSNSSFQFTVNILLVGWATQSWRARASFLSSAAQRNPQNWEKN